MKIKPTLLLLSLLPCIQLSAQSKMHVIRATSALVDIRDNGRLSKATWTITPKLKPDLYTTANENSRVTFITDKDSVTFKVKPGKVYDFIILLNGKDSAWTQIKFAANPGYLGILKRAGKYSLSESRSVPKFTYQVKETPALAALRREFKLDSIAGGGNEVSKIINMMHWVHNLIPHDGEHDNPVVKNAMNMITECRREKKGLNCRGLATVLNECYLSMGIRSRFVTCMPRDSVFADCHVINTVWSDELGKWLWMDPTNDAWVMNEKGELLGIAEVRERLITGQTVILNPDANWNHRSSALKEEYLYNYMAKNLYRFECPLSSEYDTETSSNGKRIDYIELLPLDGLNQLPWKSDQTAKSSGIRFTNYKTNNPNLFWSRP